MVIFHSYVKLPEGIVTTLWLCNYGDIVRYNVKKQIDWGYNGNMTGIDRNMKDIPIYPLVVSK